MIRSSITMGLTEFRVVELRWGSGTYLCAGGSLVLWTPCVCLGRPHPRAILARALNSHLWPVYLMSTFSDGSSLSLSLSQLSLARLPPLWLAGPDVYRSFRRSITLPPVRI